MDAHKKRVQILEQVLETIVGLSQEKFNIQQEKDALLQKNFEMRQERDSFAEALNWLQTQLMLLYSLVIPSDCATKQFGTDLSVYFNIETGDMADLINAIRANIETILHEVEILTRENNSLKMQIWQQNKDPGS
jgi:FtsZ-binding cell division protein ZapB